MITTHLSILANYTPEIEALLPKNRLYKSSNIEKVFIVLTAGDTA